MDSHGVRTAQAGAGGGRRGGRRGLRGRIVIAAAARCAERYPMTGTDDTDTLLLWLRLKCAPGIGARTATSLLAHFGTIEALFAAPEAAFDVPSKSFKQALSAHR